MFLQTFRRILQNSHSYKHPTVRLFNNVYEPKLSTNVAVPNICRVRVTGKVTNIHHRDDQLVFYVNSICAGNYRKSHKVVVTGNNVSLHKLVSSKLDLNQNVAIEGKLSTARFQTGDMKHRSSSAIIANEVCIVSDYAVANGPDADPEQSQPIDENNVELIGTITTNVVGSDFKSFTLATIKNKNNNPKQAINKSFNRIFVYDHDLFPLLEEVNIKSDEFLVRGEISYRLNKDSSGKTTSSSYIIAKQIYRL